VSELRVVTAEREDVADPRLFREAEALRRRLRRLALDVHDGPMQSLIAAGFGIRDLQRRNPAGRAELLDRLGEIAEELEGAEQSLRELIGTLDMEGKGTLDSLAAIATREVERFQRSCPIAVDLCVSTEGYPDSHSQEIAIRSVLREALSNVVKHANADAVRVSVDADAAGIRLRVEDNGCGFEPSSTPPGRMGLASMRERLQFLGGMLIVSSTPGGPTSVTASFSKWHGRLGS
jgi:signal transduction histidine kinase